ncbi:unnamed protein product [Phytophthora fragariaefolia]|uniref:Unnamed protein product n=1 Tax=Phytophthora fragariaefolia TaxID=1490495 RepID=A0A9W6X1G7_9STRA|nr:unnamed protein product [Phytophthora fragariaefolia]
MAEAAEGSKPTSSSRGALIMPPPIPNIPDTVPATNANMGKNRIDDAVHCGQFQQQQGKTADTEPVVTSPLHCTLIS